MFLCHARAKGRPFRGVAVCETIPSIGGGRSTLHEKFQNLQPTHVVIFTMAVEKQQRQLLSFLSLQQSLVPPPQPQ
eukprot:scaffold6486_cov96-Cylindrotheca_fusiformis.AAC.9